MTSACRRERMSEHALLLGSTPSHRIWGGTVLARHLGVIGGDPIGELWLAYDANPVLSGVHAGRRVADVLAELGSSFIGAVPFERYGLELPLLIKFLDTAEWLSVQVHPGDAFAHTVEHESGFHGKTEAWYILEGEGELIYGVSEPVGRDALRAAALEGTIGALLSHVRVAPGDVLYVPAGTIHALGPGLVLYEVQQRSDLTYRLYDYGRSRDLQLERGLEVARRNPAAAPKLVYQPGEGGTVLLASDAFMLVRHDLDGADTIAAPAESFLLLTLVNGTACWHGRDLRWGETLLIGAGSSVQLRGRGTLLASLVPSPSRLRGYAGAVHAPI